MYAEMPLNRAIRPPLLSPWESERVQAFRNRERRSRWLAGRSLAKVLVKERLGLGGIIEIREGADGEPLVYADGFPLTGPGSLFKKRPRRQEFIKSFGFDGGLQVVCDAAARTPGLKVELGVTVTALRRQGAGFTVTTGDGRTFEAPVAALAIPPDAAAPLVRHDFPELASQISRVKTVTVDSLGVVLPREKAWMPESAFLVPVDDIFHSCVTRDPFPDPRLRGFAFHFKPGQTRQARLARVLEVLRVQESDLLHLAEKHVSLPSPALGHGEVVAELDRCLAGTSLALTGNYFEGLAIEDCVLRSNAEWRRVGPAAG